MSIKMSLNIASVVMNTIKTRNLFLSQETQVKIVKQK